MLANLLRTLILILRDSNPLAQTTLNAKHQNLSIIFYHDREKHRWKYLISDGSLPLSVPGGFNTDSLLEIPNPGTGSAK